MGDEAPKVVLHRYLRTAREGVLWKVDGLSEREVRRPMVPTGTNLLGLVKHLACVEYAYFGTAFDRPPPELVPWWDDDAEPNADMWATAEESRDQVLGLYGRACAHADRTIDELELDSVGHVSWWPEDRQTPALHTLLVAVIARLLPQCSPWTALRWSAWWARVNSPWGTGSRAGAAPGCPAMIRWWVVSVVSFD